MQNPTSPEEPDALHFSDPVPVYFVNGEDTVITEPLLELKQGMRVGIPNPWSKDETWAIGTIRSLAGEWVLDVGQSLGKLVQGDDGWGCSGLVRLGALAEAITFPLPAAGPLRFTDRLLRRRSKKSAPRR